MNLDRVGAGVLLIAAMSLAALPATAAAPVQLGASTNQVASTRGGLPELAPREIAPRPAVRPLAAVAGAAGPGLEGAGELRISRVVFEGNTVIPSSELAAIARPFEGQTVTLASLKALAAQVSEYYQARGYLLAQALLPVQTVRRGAAIRIVVSEGRYGEVRIEGNKHYSSRFIRRHFAPALKTGLVEEPSLMRALLLFNEYADLSVRSLFLPGSKPGASDLVLKASDRSLFHYGLDYNNYGSPLTGRNRVGLSVSDGNIVWDGDQLFAHVVDQFPSDSSPVIQAGYSAPVGTVGDRLAYSFSSAKTRVGGDLAVLDLRGDAEIHALTWSHPITRTLSRSTNATAGFVSKTVKNFALATTLVSQDDLRELTLGLDTSRVHRKSRTLGSVLGTVGLGEFAGGDLNNVPGAAAAAQPNALASRAGAGNEFAKINADVFQIFDLGEGRSLIGRFSGQVASDALAVAEQFALGGPDSVRGYLQADFLGDDGYTTSVEYRHPVYTNAAHKVEVQAEAFVDHGDASVQRPQVGERASASFTGVGAGLRGSFGRTTTMRLELGFPLSARNSINTDSILYAQLASRW